MVGDRVSPGHGGRPGTRDRLRAFCTWIRRQLPDGLKRLAPIVSAPLLIAVLACTGSDPFSAIGPLLGSGHVEWSEHGVVITVPDDWAIREARPETAGALEGMEWLQQDGVSALAVKPPTGDGSCWFVSDDPAERGEPVHLSRWAAANDAEADGWQLLGRSRVDLPAGPAFRIELEGPETTRVTYVLRGHLGIYALICTAPKTDQAGTDPWLPIAETIAFLPDAATGAIPSSPVTGGGRIERPTDGFAVRVPDDWTVENVDAVTDAWLDGSLSPGERALRTTLFWADDPNGDVSVRVADITREGQATGWASVDAATAAFDCGIERHPAVIASETEVVELPAGRVGHNTSTHEGGYTFEDYYFSDMGRWFRLRCESGAPPSDACISIAETFEFLPEEE